MVTWSVCWFWFRWDCPHLQWEAQSVLLWAPSLLGSWSCITWWSMFVYVNVVTFIVPPTHSLPLSLSLSLSLPLSLPEERRLTEVWLGCRKIFRYNAATYHVVHLHCIHSHLTMVSPWADRLVRECATFPYTVEPSHKGHIRLFKRGCPLFRGYECIVGIQKQAFGTTNSVLWMEVNTIVS